MCLELRVMEFIRLSLSTESQIAFSAHAPDTQMKFLKLDVTVWHGVHGDIRHAVLCFLLEPSSLVHQKLNQMLQEIDIMGRFSEPLLQYSFLPLSVGSSCPGNLVPWISVARLWQRLLRSYGPNFCSFGWFCLNRGGICS